MCSQQNHLQILSFLCHADKLDAVRSLRKRKRLVSDEEEERGELSLTEYLMRKMNEEEVGSKKKRVRASMK